MIYLVATACLLTLLAFVLREVGMRLMVWPERRGVRVLMYHHIDCMRCGDYTTTTAQFQEQLEWLRSQGFCFISMTTFIEAKLGRSTLPDRPVLITFDDAYVDFATGALPIIETLRVPTTMFVPIGFMGKTNAWDDGLSPIMSREELANLPSIVELGYHSMMHTNYRGLTTKEVETDIEQSREHAAKSGLQFVDAFAYPYGGLPCRNETDQQLDRMLAESGMQVAFRIGNRILRAPFKSAFRIQRLDMRGTLTRTQWIRRLKYGRTLLK